MIFGPSVNVSRVLPRLLADPRFHHCVIGDAEGRRLSIATAQNSAEAYRAIWQSDGASLGQLTSAIEWDDLGRSRRPGAG